MFSVIIKKYPGRISMMLPKGQRSHSASMIAQRLRADLFALFVAACAGLPMSAGAGSYACTSPAKLTADGEHCSDGSIAIYRADSIISDRPARSGGDDVGTNLRSLGDLPEIDRSGVLHGVEAYREYPRVVGFKCSNIEQCEVVNGALTGQTDINLAGKYPAVAGQTIFAVLVDSERRLRDKRLVGIAADGRLSVGIPVGTLPADSYRLGLMERVPGAKPFAMAIFELQRNAGQPVSPQPESVSDDKSAVMAGDWYGINGTAGQLTLRADGTYAFNGIAGGRYAVSGRRVHFTGNLSAWDNGNATINGDALEFSWTTPSGARQWMVFGR